MELFCLTFHPVLNATNCDPSNVTKLENGGWSNEEVLILKDSLAQYRLEQRSNLRVAQHCLRTAHFALTGGAIVAVISFGLVLTHSGS
jgi:hypothetical protein